MKFPEVIVCVGCAFGLAIAGNPSQSIQQISPTETPSPHGSSSISRFFDQDRFHAMFPDAIDLYNFNDLVEATHKYAEFANTGNDTNDKRELAAFLAQTACSSDDFKAAEEYARNNYTVWQYCDNSTYPCAPGRRYHGRGAIELSWNYNYYNAGEALGVDLFNNPDIVAKDKTMAWLTAIWYWMTPQDGKVIHDVVTGMDGFALSTDIIMGEHKCEDEEERVKYFHKMCEALDVEPLGNVSCKA